MFTYSEDQSRNFLHTFGYLQLALAKSFPFDQLKQDVSSLASKHFSTTWDEILKQKAPLAVQPFADNSETASHYLVNTLDPYIKSLLGENYIYLGSDASIFFAPGNAWHRDMASQLPVLKLLIYLDYDYKDTSCDFLIVPGSHHINSAYSSLLQQGLQWPHEHGFLGGITDNGFFPAPSDPTSPCYSNDIDAIPSQLIKVKKGMAIIFNQSAIHAVKSAIPIGKPRRLVTYNFCPNPKDLSTNHFSRLGKSEISDECLINYIYKIYAMQLKRLGINNYGSELLKFPGYIKSHGLDWDRVIDASNKIAISLEHEDGTHSTVQTDKMAEFLIENIPVYSVV